MSGSDVIYLDSSAIVKLVLEEPESTLLRRYLYGVDEPSRLVSSELVWTEVHRSVARAQLESVPDAEQQIRELVLIAVSRSVLQSAGTLEPRELRTLDAIHVASALALGDELTEIITYDRRMQAAATAVGVAWAAPGQALAEADAPPA